jgi:hypothetical protein
MRWAIRDGGLSGPRITEQAHAVQDAPAASTDSRLPPLRHRRALPGPRSNFDQPGEFAAIKPGPESSGTDDYSSPCSSSAGSSSGASRGVLNAET